MTTTEFIPALKNDTATTKDAIIKSRVENHHQQPQIPRTTQEIFSLVATGLLTQNRKSQVDGCCMYRFNGLKCAAGFVISDENYKPYMENKKISTVIDQFHGLANLMPHVNLLNKLQKIHDMSIVADWPVELAAVAAEFNLVFNPTKE